MNNLNTTVYDMLNHLEKIQSDEIEHILNQPTYPHDSNRGNQFAFTIIEKTANALGLCVEDLLLSDAQKALLVICEHIQVGVLNIEDVYAVEKQIDTARSSLAMLSCYIQESRKEANIEPTLPF